MAGKNALAAAGRSLLAGATRVRVLNLRELAGHRLRVITSLIVVIVSSALLIAVLGAYGSMTESVRTFNAAISGDATVEVAGIADSGVDQDLVTQLRREVDDAKAVVPMVRGSVLLDGTSTTLLGSDARVSALSAQMRAAMAGAGDDLDPARLEDGVIAGAGTGLRPGQHVQISGAQVTVLEVVDDPSTRVLNGGRFLFAYLPLAQRLTGLDGAVDSILIVPQPGVGKSALREQVAAVVGGRAAVLDPDFRVKQAETAGSVTRDSTLLVSAVSLIIAAFLVFNTMNMAVASRRQSLAMIRALGARRRHLVGDLLAESAIFGAIGGLIGVPLGVLAGRWAISRLPGSRSGVPVEVSYHLPGYAVPLAVLACLIACVAATALAARSVFAVEPVEAMVPGAAADAAPPRRSTRLVAGLIGLALVVGSVVMGLTVPGRPVILAGAVFAVGALLVCFGITTVLVRAVVIVSGRLRGPGRLAAVNSERAPRRVWATVMTVAVAIAVGMGISGALNNMVASISDSLAGLDDPDLYVSSQSMDEIPTGPILDPRIAEEVSTLPGVGQVVGGQWATANIGDARAQLQGLRPESMAPFMRKTSPAALTRVLDGDGMVLSSVLARTLDVETGDTLRLATPTGYHDLVVREVVNYPTIDSGTGAMSAPLLEKWFDRPGDTYLQVQLAPGADAAQIREQLAEVAARHPGAGNTPVHVYSGAEALRSTQRTVEQSGAFTVAIQWIVAGAAALALLNTLLLSVIERRRELGVLRAMGASRRFVVKMVLAEAGSVAAVGAVTGVVIGTGLHALADVLLTETTSIDIAYRPQLSAVLYVAVAALLCLLGALVPALRASRMNITDALQSE